METVTMTLVEFLTARLDEDEEGARLPGSESRLLREVEAKRAIVALAREAQQRMMDGPDFHKDGTFHTVSAWMRTTLVHLAAVYADHPDYQPGWRP